MSDVAAVQQFERNRDALNARIAELVKAITDVGEARMKSEDHRMDPNNYVHAANHRRVAEDGARRFNDAVAAYVTMRRGPQPNVPTKCIHEFDVPHEYRDVEGRVRGCPGPTSP